MSSNQNTYGCVMENGKAPICQPCLGEMSRAQCLDRCRPGVHQLLGCDPSSGLCRQGSGTHESCPQCDQRPCSAQPLGQLLGYRCAPEGCKAVYSGTLDPSEIGVPLFPTLEACAAAGCGVAPPIGHLLGYRCESGECKPVYAGSPGSEVGTPLFATAEECRAAGCQQPSCDTDACALEPRLDSAFVLGVTGTVLGGVAILAIFFWAAWSFFGNSKSTTTTRTISSNSINY